ncbi:segmentation polarity homeobox protein engrailed-like [Vespa crabro]|uniref:segmentation polarity homeobox protein engrailed-like n=1 Tax=Vespa crabro TaxID=7445 RepID=UPI001F01794B|nr:segmentation polarity homeobox protein engrailed-like [Vespa crabro]
MSCDVDKGTVPESTENDHLLENRNDVRMTSCSILPEQSGQRHHRHHHHHHYHHHHHHQRQARYQHDSCRNIPTNEKSNQNGPFGIVDGSSHDVISGTLPSIVVSDVDENDEDPPPYSAIVPPDHVAWPFVFSTHIPYSVHATQPCITEPPLAPFQIPPSPSPIPLPPLALASTSPVQQSSSLQQPPTTTHRLETPSLDSTTPTLSLTPYRFFKFDSHRSIIDHRSSIFTDNVSTDKQIQGRSRKYGGILIATAVIVFLMVLSLMVRFVMEKSFRRQ